MSMSHLLPALTGLPAPLYLMSAPGVAGPLDDELDDLRDLHGVALIVTLVGEWEVDFLGLRDLEHRAHERGIEALHFPIAPFSTPASPEALRSLVDHILAVARAGHAVAIHCWAGLGRTGMVAACCLVSLGFRPDEAIVLVREQRPGSVETVGQEDFIATFARS
jgi:protein-tyrosine phosphatase